MSSHAPPIWSKRKMVRVTRPEPGQKSLAMAAEPGRDIRSMTTHSQPAGAKVVLTPPNTPRGSRLFVRGGNRLSIRCSRDRLHKQGIRVNQEGSFSWHRFGAEAEAGAGDALPYLGPRAIFNSANVTSSGAARCISSMMRSHSIQRKRSCKPSPTVF